MPQSLQEMIRQIPDAQEKLLERMMQLGLVQSFGRNAQTGRWAIVYTPRGREFLATVRSVTEGDDEYRLARLAALDALTAGQGVFGGFAES